MQLEKKIKNTFIFTAGVLCMISQVSVKALFFFPGKTQKASSLQCAVGWVPGGSWVGQAAGLEPSTPTDQP